MILFLWMPFVYSKDWIAIDKARTLFISTNGLKMRDGTVTMWSKKRDWSQETISYDMYDCKKGTVENIDIQLFFLNNERKQEYPLSKPKTIKPNSDDETLFKAACNLKETPQFFNP